jgi:hypothetical protein
LINSELRIKSRKEKRQQAEEATDLIVTKQELRRYGQCWITDRPVEDLDLG